MSMTRASSEYFAENAGKWDSLRAGYFTEAVRDKAIAKAYLLPEMVVADAGAGTGFMAAGLAPRVKGVHVIDGSAAMLEVARQNLSGFSNIFYHQAEGQSIPLEDGSVDAVFANMYLHHCPDPLAAIREMVRILRPGGRLVITDLDSHPYTWLKEEMADEWMGFERRQIKAWLREADLANLIVDGTDESCSAESQHPEQTGPEGNPAKEEGSAANISIFVATGTRRLHGMREAVQTNYAAAAAGAGCGCSSPAQDGSTACCGASAQVESQISGSTACCSSTQAFQDYSELEGIPVLEASPVDVDFATGYSPAEMQAVPAEAAEISLGCGNPIAMANLRPGEVVLDIGSGGGIDAFLSARQVGPTGKVIGVDMTPEMLERARRTAEKAGLEQVEFRFGQAEALPVEDGSVDVVISNCVINLCEDKGRVFEEAFRVLNEGGRLEVSDMVIDRPFPLHLSGDAQQWSGCILGALPEREYLDLVAQAGFTGITTRRSASAGAAGGVNVYSVIVSAQKTGSG